ncbi:hypothetical protein bhYOR_001089 (plasmid) [Borrelia nietonii YOR]|uniref:hypothetical protein n=1 Tax=Borrelia nietonii TaxID=3117462 RepID=UPI001FF4E1D8|nr:hypothetical protein [Borrelia nietonii]UPA09783.1 hypothetical protein bhYOR_001089 [Borrelia nietonii YOR]
MKYKIFIIFILTGLFIPLLALVSCNPKPEKLGGGGVKFLQTLLIHASKIHHLSLAAEQLILTVR